MSEEKKGNKLVTKNEAVTKVIKETAMQYFLRQSESLMDSLRVNSATGKRLVYSIVTAGGEALAKCGRKWDDIKQADFVQKISINACAGMDAASGDLYVYPWREESGGKTVMVVAKTALGWQKAMHKYGTRKPKMVRAHALLEGDVFDYEETDNGIRFTYKPSLNPAENAKVIGAFAYIKYEDGGDDFLYWAKAEIIRRKKQGESTRGGKESPAWKNWEKEVVESKILRTLIADRVPLDIPAEMQPLVEKDEDAEPENPMKPRIVLTPDEYGEAVESEEEPQELEPEPEPEKPAPPKEQPKQEKPKTEPAKAKPKQASLLDSTEGR